MAEVFAIMYEVLSMQSKLHQLTENVKLLQKVAIVHDDKVLLLKRADDAVSRPGCWDLPGGNSEWPTADQTGWGALRKDAIREVEEETALQLSEADFSTSNIVFLDTFFTGETFTMIVGWKVELKELNSKIEISHEHSELKWVAREEVESLDFGGEKGEWVKEIVMS